MEFPKVEGDPIAWWWESPINFTQGTWFTFSLQNNLVVCTWFEKNIFAIFSQLKKFASHPFLDICVWTFEYKRKRDLDKFLDKNGLISKCVTKFVV